jgi:hypothetical protein
VVDNGHIDREALDRAKDEADLEFTQRTLGTLRSSLTLPPARGQRLVRRVWQHRLTEWEADNSTARCSLATT